MEQKILVVEDSRPFRRVIESELRQAGYTPVLANSIAEAEAVLDNSTDFLCAILDYCLPDGQDGEIIDVCLSVGIKVIVLTALMDEMTREKVLAKTVIDYIPKDSPTCISSMIPILQRLERNHDHTALVVDDSITARKYIRSLLERQYLTVLEARSGEQALEMINSNKSISLVITDYSMPERDGVSLIKELRKRFRPGQLAVIGLSASEEPALTAKFLKAGANDFLKKPFNQEEFYCRLHSTLNILDSERNLYLLANRDYLTQAWNRRYFFNHQLVKKNTGPRCLALLDIDNFKQLNDSYGHHIGDMVLIELANTLQIYFPDALVARFGGEEFCILYGNAPDIFIQRLNRLIEEIAQSELTILGNTIKYTISLGITHAESDIHSLIHRADNCLYKAKEKGRNCLIAE
ncbi:diguanylate cyclase response regulator [Photobacterium gaetbulicola]|uniref:diguanylate cyclase n=1 Tax=Photobacterium gaetbulicola Gung47 TaxID=658445 RepID=A0A0C5WJ60_9GAMM|nr:response regulator [Photobacterium gaetbulicola]AJR05189.1 putative response regulator protein [Photobacterium gaetbulicola Gung47]PSU06023.1 diguanylate cyclase response regulator [Photobacterium gaetbulicola]